MSKLDELIAGIFNLIGEDKELLHELPSAAALILANTPLMDETFDPENKLVTWLSNTKEGKPALVSVDYDILEYTEACHSSGITDIKPKECIVFNKKPLTEPKKVVH